MPKAYINGKKFHVTLWQLFYPRIINLSKTTQSKSVTCSFLVYHSIFAILRIWFWSFLHFEANFPHHVFTSLISLPLPPDGEVKNIIYCKFIYIVTTTKLLQNQTKINFVRTGWQTEKKNTHKNRYIQQIMVENSVNARKWNQYKLTDIKQRKQNATQEHS